LDIDLKGIHWVIVGGESGQKNRPMQAEWVENIQQQCEEAEVAFFFKQWGGRTPKAGGRLLDEKIWDEMPEAWGQHQKQWNAYTLSVSRKSNKVVIPTLVKR
jgi:protein gp37